MRRKLAAGNWKMNGSGADLAMLGELARRHPAPDCQVLICPPATLIDRAARAVDGSAIAIGGQDCHFGANGAHTGDISAAMLAEAGATAVIVGHSERRQDHHENNDMVRAKAEAALAAGLTAILCVGESQAQREAGRTLDVIAEQLAGSMPQDATAHGVVIAYEPIWAIGTGLVAEPAQISQVHEFLRAQLRQRLGEQTGQAIRLLYGGSVKPANAAEIFAVADVDGALVGGASLSAADFAPIIAALDASA
ncbi:triose-phosphate isomerase [Sedimentitalea sp. HM32M-2]|uniref:triose-phosphate isomerase n=1 Tax=Sedimentitalea sp. HM32M-2 TaxID=3351566 RepID=UPI00363E342F